MALSVETAGRRLPFGRKSLVGLPVAVAIAVGLLVGGGWSRGSSVIAFESPCWERSWKDPNCGGMVVDTVILVSLPLLIALIGGVMFSARYTLRRIMVVVAVLAIVLGALETYRRRIRRLDSLATYHWSQIASVLYRQIGTDGKMTYTLAGVDHQGRPLTAGQREIDRWHEAMYQKFLRALRQPWRNVPPGPPPPR